MLDFEIKRLSNLKCPLWISRSNDRDYEYSTIVLSSVIISILFNFTVLINILFSLSAWYTVIVLQMRLKSSIIIHPRD